MAIRDDFEVVAGQVRSAVQRFALGLLIIAAFGIMLVGKADTVLVEHVRVVALDLATPMLEAIARPVGVANRAIADLREFASLREENARLRASEGRFARFMQHLPGLAWIKDVQGRYVYANEAAEAAFGIPRSDLYGKTDAEVFPPETAAQFEANDRRASADGAGVRTIETLEHGDGILHHSLVSKFPIPGPDGEPEAVVV